ncbi:unnamed protein product (macronuclear) [Paramecium tetraurelia]|uniref:TLDc domain-containing protein n=1 Tax=Paramecium tetraurelia TaxID=5888 RepID=A0BLA6_PARTE|nr:uncharacterized protein GSPATT00029955001 [Paramecium tetraurelia]CAK59323.1 unnamed protein product [Paramecium tetraurelia]|eukprot:XP_001426721.1 hypothetical protein (macronuclear) [Paramecium tetraurelia strain d4-2]
MLQVPCFKHEGQYLLFFLPQKEATQYFCDICLLSLQEQSNLEKFQKLIHINKVQLNQIKALKYPEYLITKLDIDQQLLNYFNEFSQQDEVTLIKELKEIELKIQEMHTVLTKLFQQLKIVVQAREDLKQKIRSDLNQIVKLDQLKEIISSLSQLGDTINPQAIEKSEQTLHQYIKDLMLNNSAYLNEKLYDVLDQKQNQVKDLKEEKYPEFRRFGELYRQISEKHFSFNKWVDPKLLKTICCSLLTEQFSQKIQDIIQSKTGKKISQAQMIYQGTKDGLNGQIFLTKVNGKSNLLLVFKSSSQYIFGAYTPLKWIKQVANYQYIQDDSCSSLIFSQTHDQIYSLKQESKSLAICFSSGYPIAFGGGHDISINSDFQTGYSNLGFSYQWEQYKNVKSNHLFGQDQPKIQECEVFELIFF